jgi:hypothetical protein
VLEEMLIEEKVRERAGLLLPESVLRRYPLFSRASLYYRRRRIEKFIRLMKITAGTTILDIGGQPYFWQGFPIKAQVTCLNLYAEAGVVPDHVTMKLYDGPTLPFENQSFEVVHSNSVIEHVGDYHAQKRFAREIARVGRKYWVQTPNYYFPYEPHAQFPFFQFLPPNLKLLIARNWKKAGYPYDELMAIQLLTQSQLLDLFPGSRLWKERLFGVAKSYCIYRA